MINKRLLFTGGAALVFAGMLCLGGSPLHADPKTIGVCEETPTGHDGPFVPDSLKTITGSVVQIDRMEKMHGVCLGVHLTLKTGDQAARVHLAPCAFMKAHGIDIQLKDVVTATGSTVDVCGNPELMASEITKGKKTLRLRDESGRPLWTAPVIQ